jgi:hypothetical protein
MYGGYDEPLGEKMMRRITALMVALIAFMACTASTSFAATIGFAPSSLAVGVGDSFSVDIVVSGLAGEIVSAYDLDITYDSSIILPTSVTFGSLLGDQSAFEVFNAFDMSASGVVDLAQLSLLSDTNLLALQGGDSFVLATLGFDATSLGTTNLDFVFDSINNITGLNAQTLNITAASGSVAVVPEPTAATLFLLGALMFNRPARGRRRI